MGCYGMRSIRSDTAMRQLIAVPNDGGVGPEQHPRSGSGTVEFENGALNLILFFNRASSPAAKLLLSSELLPRPMFFGPTNRSQERIEGRIF